MYEFSERSKAKLATVDIKLQNLMNVAIKESPYDFSITEGIRTMKRQIELVAQGKSKTLKSYHLTGKAVDIAVWIFQNFSSLQFMNVDSDNIDMRTGFQNFSSLQFIAIFSSFINL